MRQRTRLSTRTAAHGEATGMRAPRPVRFDPAPLVQAAERCWGAAAAFTAALRHCPQACVVAGSFRFHVPLADVPALDAMVALQLPVGTHQVVVYFGAHPLRPCDMQVMMTEVAPAQAPPPLFPHTDMNVLQAWPEVLPEEEEEPADPSITHLRVVHVKED